MKFSAPLPLAAATAFLADRFGWGVVEEGGVEVVEAVELLALDLLVDEDLDGFGVVEFVGGKKSFAAPPAMGGAAKEGEQPPECKQQ